MQLNSNNLYKLSLFLYIVFLPISISIRQAGIILLTLVFVYDCFKNKAYYVLFKWTENKFLLIFLCYLLFNSLFVSMDSRTSLDVLFNAIWQCFLVYYILSSITISKKVDKNYILLLLMISVTIQGIDGIYQFVTGYDFIKHLKPFGDRLTASLDTPRVGNFVSLSLPAFFAYYFRNNDTFESWKAKLLLFVAFLPPLFLLIFSKTRSGWVGFFVFLSIFSFYNVRKLFLPVFSILVLILFFFKKIILNRLNFNIILNDPRFELWTIALKLFKLKPIFGHGVATFCNAFNYYHLYPTKTSRHIQHPHNIYVQFLSETGIIGLLLFFTFIFGRLFNLLKTFLKTKSILLWIYVAWICSYLATAFSAHNFFRTWWLGTFMIVFAITSPEDETSSF
ncbi:O-antigen ligase family protein [Deferribacter autotrophicus]|nr:O-antigen ligase family protein [Deferribacter autotrophicus]